MDWRECSAPPPPHTTPCVRRVCPEVEAVVEVVYKRFLTDGGRAGGSALPLHRVYLEIETVVEVVQKVSTHGGWASGNALPLRRVCLWRSRSSWKSVARGALTAR